MVFSAIQLNCVTCVFLIGQELKNREGNTAENRLLRALLLLEPFLRTDLVKSDIYAQTVLEQLDALAKGDDSPSNVTVKAKKSALTIRELCKRSDRK